jgi:ParB family transcriptional regulator, chromosome partitioning protein
MARKRAQLTDEGTMATLGAGGILDRIGDEVATIEVREIPITQIQPNPFQPRQHFPKESVEELSTSIREHGFYGHLLVRRKGRSHQLAYGERRLRAAKLADLETIPVQIRELSDTQMIEIALTENVLREDLHPVEEARGYLRLQEEMGYSVRQIAERIGKSKSYVGTLLSIVRYSDLEEAVRTADIPVRTAEELAKIENPEERRYYTELVVAGKLDRDKLIEARQSGHPRQTVRTADRQQDVTATISRIYRTLERQQFSQVQPDEKDKAIRLLRRIIEQASQLLESLEQE